MGSAHSKAKNEHHPKGKIIVKNAKNTPTLELVVGNHVCFHGAVFEITSTQIYDDKGDPVMSANGKWLDGVVVNGYFGPNKDWTFQGNRHAYEAVLQA